MTRLTPVLLAAALAAAPARGADDRPPPSHVRAELLSELARITPGRAFTAAVRLRMDEGWHTYWKNPGDSGMPTRVAWKLPAGFKAGELRWPTPLRFGSSRSVSYGYEGEAVLLAELEPPPGLAPGAAVPLSAKVKWLECRDVCVPGESDLTLTLTAAETPGKDPAAASVIAAARARIPSAPGAGPFAGVAVRADRLDGTVRLTVDPSSAPSAAFFPAEDGVIDNDQEPVLGRSGRALTVDLAPAKAPGAARASRLAGVLVLGRPGRAVELSVPIENPLEGGSCSEKEDICR